MFSIRPSRMVLVLAAMLSALVGTRAAAEPPTWGFRAGGSAARLHGWAGDILAPQYRQDFTAGGFLRFRLGRLLSFRPEAAWAIKGGELDARIVTFPSPGTVDVTDTHMEHRFGYVEFPLLMQLELQSLGAAEPYILAGPAPAVRVGEDQSEISTTTTTRPASAARAASLIFEQLGTVGSAIPTRRFDVGLVGGLGLWLGRGWVRFGLEGRYTYGALDVDSRSQAETRNGAFAVTTAIEFR